MCGRLCVRVPVGSNKRLDIWYLLLLHQPCSTNEQEKDWRYVIPSECCTNEQEKDWRYVIPSKCCTNEQEKDWRYVIPSEQH
jgi:hypothetical protein